MELKLDQASPDALALEHAVRVRVDQEGVPAAIPRDIHQTDHSTISCPCGDPTETVGPCLIPPTLDSPPAMRAHQTNQLGIGQLAT